MSKNFRVKYVRTFSVFENIFVTIMINKTQAIDMQKTAKSKFKVYGRHSVIFVFFLSSFLC